MEGKALSGDAAAVQQALQHLMQLLQQQGPSGRLLAITTHALLRLQRYALQSQARFQQVVHLRPGHCLLWGLRRPAAALQGRRGCGSPSPSASRGTGGPGHGLGVVGLRPGCLAARQSPAGWLPRLLAVTHPPCSQVARLLYLAHCAVQATPAVARGELVVPPSADLLPVLACLTEVAAMKQKGNE